MKTYQEAIEASASWSWDHAHHGHEYDDARILSVIYGEDVRQTLTRLKLAMRKYIRVRHAGLPESPLWS